MSSLRNVVQRRNHKERSQPQERSKWGLLEKHKDYTLRAKDHNAKKRKIKALQSKAAQRNEDEFYFGMMRSQTRNGVKIAQRGQQNSGGQEGAGKSLSMDVVKLMKTQDVGYLRTVLQSTKKARARLEQDVTAKEIGVSTDVVEGHGRTTFDENGKAISASRDAGAEEDDDILLDELLDLDGVDMDDIDGIESEPDVDNAIDPEEATSPKQSALIALRRRLEALKKQEQILTTALREVEDQQARMKGTAGGVNKNGIRFKSRQRQG